MTQTQVEYKAVLYTNHCHLIPEQLLTLSLRKGAVAKPMPGEASLVSSRNPNSQMNPSKRVSRFPITGEATVQRCKTTDYKKHGLEAQVLPPTVNH